MDEQESERNRASLSSHARFVEVGEKLLVKVLSEIERYQERMEELKVCFLTLFFFLSFFLVLYKSYVIQG